MKVKKGFLNKIFFEKINKIKFLNEVRIVSILLILKNSGWYKKVNIFNGKGYLEILILEFVFILFKLDDLLLVYLDIVEDFKFFNWINCKIKLKIDVKFIRNIKNKIIFW